MSDFNKDYLLKLKNIETNQGRDVILYIENTQGIVDRQNCALNLMQKYSDINSEIR